MFTVTDEAFALTMVMNQISNWKELAKDVSLRSPQNLKKKFTRPIEGCRNSWNMEGQMIYFDVMREIKKLRNDPETGINFETNLMQQYQANDQKYIMEQEQQAKQNERIMGLAAALDESFFDGDDLLDFLNDKGNGHVDDDEGNNINK